MVGGHHQPLRRISGLFDEGILSILEEVQYGVPVTKILLRSFDLWVSRIGQRDSQWWCDRSGGLAAEHYELFGKRDGLVEIMSDENYG